MRRPRSLALCLGLLAAGCSDAETGPDAGTTLDAGAMDDGGSDAGVLDVGPPVDAGPLPTPQSVLFIGNSFTNRGPVPKLVADLARYAGFDGFAPLKVALRAVDGRSLERHREDVGPASASEQIALGWDIVVLQEFSTRPTDQVGPADQFEADATYFYDLAKAANPACNVVLFETWARRADHELYPDTFTDPQQMQDELRYYYFDAAYRYIPTYSTAERKTDVRVAQVGDAWALQLEGGEPPRLHDDDSYHAGPAGQYLNALVLYATIFSRRADGQVPLGDIDESTAVELQATADSIVRSTGWGASLEAPAELAIGATVRVDLGPTGAAGWPAITHPTETIAYVATASGAESGVYVTAFGFTGAEAAIGGTDTLGLPAEVGGDSLWLGTFDGHEAALEKEARLVVRGLPEGRYEFALYARRVGNDAGLGRLARYRIQDEVRDLEESDNADTRAVFEDVAPDARGEVVIRVGVSPDGASRFADVGALWVTRRE